MTLEPNAKHWNKNKCDWHVSILGMRKRMRDTIAFRAYAFFSFFFLLFRSWALCDLCVCLRPPHIYPYCTWLPGRPFGVTSPFRACVKCFKLKSNVDRHGHTQHNFGIIQYGFEKKIMEGGTTTCLDNVAYRQNTPNIIIYLSILEWSVFFT